jgi:hypothetical protein
MSTRTIIPATIAGAMLANIDVLQLRLCQARYRAADALAAMRAEQRNLAIGILMDLEHLLPEIDALYRTIRLLHRSRDISIGSEQVQP